jgi:quercetin dioxygenase-like cupin family protein
VQKVRESDIPFRGGDSGVKYLFRGPNIDWGVIVLPPGDSLAGHYHEQVEETFYLLEGQISLTSKGQKHALTAGDAVRLEAPEPHEITNSGEANAKLLFLKYPYLPKDKVNL